MVGASAWRLAYQQPLADALRVIYSDRRRHAWVHLWMIPPLFLTPAGLAGVTIVLDTSTAVVASAMAAVVYTIGAVCWIASWRSG